MNCLAESLVHNLSQRLYESWRIVQSCSHFKVRNAKPVRFFPRFVINFSERFHVIGNECHRHDTHLAHPLGSQLAQSLVQGRLKPSTGAHFALITDAMRIAPSTALDQQANRFFDLMLVGIALLYD